MSYENLDPAQTNERMQADSEWVYLDVRSQQEFEAGHVPGAYNIPLLFVGPAGMQPNAEFASQVKKHFAADAKLVVACKAGGRSLRACDLLEGEGYGQLINMDGGFHGRPDPSGRIEVEGWASRGLPTTTQAEAGRTFDELTA